MNVISVTCPRCHRRLTVSASAPRVLTCPSCLAKIERGEATPVAALAPIGAMPLEEEVRHDEIRGLVGAIVVVVLLVGGLLMAGMRAVQGASGASGMMLVGLIVVSMAICSVAVVAAGSERDVSPARRVTAAAGSIVGCAGRVVSVVLLLIGVVLLIALGLCGVMILTVH